MNVCYPAKADIQLETLLWCYVPKIDIQYPVYVLIPSPLYNIIRQSVSLVIYYVPKEL